LADIATGEEIFGKESKTSSFERQTLHQGKRFSRIESKIFVLKDGHCIMGKDFFPEKRARPLS